MALTKKAVEAIAIGKGGSYSLGRDVIKHNIWDTRYFGDTISDFTFFSLPIGGSWRVGNKTINETNMTDSGKLPSTQNFLVQAMYVSAIIPLIEASSVGSEVIQAYTSILESSVFDLRLAGKDFEFQVPGKAFNPAIAVSDLSANNHVSAGMMIANGKQNLSAIPIFIEELASFSVLQRLGNPDTAVDTILDAASAKLNAAKATMQVRLEGVLTRSK